MILVELEEVGATWNVEDFTADEDVEITVKEQIGRAHV